MIDGFGDNPLLAALRRAYAWLVVLFLVIPSLIVIPMSFSDSAMLEFPPRALSLRWYEAYWDSLAWVGATRTSFIVALLTTLVSVPCGVLAAYGATKLTGRLRMLVSGIIVLPALVPVVLIAVGLFFVLAKLGMVGTIAGLVFGHAAVAMPVVFVLMSAAFAQFDFAQEKAARSLGATWWQAWRFIILRQFTGPIVSAALLAFVTSFDEVVIAMFISSGEQSTLPRIMFISLQDQLNPTIAVVSTGLLLIASGAVYFMVRKSGFVKS